MIDLRQLKLNLVSLIICGLLSGTVFAGHNLAWGYEDNGSPVSVLDEIVPFDTYFINEREKYVRDHLNYFAMTLDDRPTEIGYVITYGGLKGSICESLVGLKKIRQYLVITKKIKPDRIIFIDGGYTKKGMVELYIQPKGVRPPTPSPSFRLSDVLNGL